jgi:hypothetical protein
MLTVAESQPIDAVVEGYACPPHIMSDVATIARAHGRSRSQLIKRNRCREKSAAAQS